MSGNQGDRASGAAGSATISAGIACIALSSILFAPLSQTATKFLASDFPLFQIVFFRSLGQTVWMVLFFWQGYGLSMFRTNALGWQLARSTLLFASFLCWISAVKVVPLATASAINFTAPIMVVVMSIPFLGEKVGWHRWGAVLVGFGGALIIVRPGGEAVPVELLYLLMAAFLFAVYQIITRKVAGVDNTAVTSIYTILVALVVSAVVMPFDYQAPASGDWVVWLAFAAAGLLGGARHYFVVKAYSFAPASVVSPFFYGELVGVAILGYLVFGDLPDGVTLLGAAIIVASGLYIAHRERLKA